MTLPLHRVADLERVEVGATVVVDGEEAHHAVAVRRVRPGEELLLTDGRGTSVRGEVTETGKRRLVVVVRDRRTDAEPQPSVVVVQALAKGDRGERAVELLTEVGVAEVVPWAAARSVAVWRGEREERGRARWEATAREAAKQARRSWFPRVAGLADLDVVVARVAGAALAVVLHEAATDPLAGLAVPVDGEVVLVVGPEGGLTDEEVVALERAGAGPVRMGAEVLRTSSAGAVAAGALLSRTARWA